MKTQKRYHDNSHNIYDVKKLMLEFQQTIHESGRKVMQASVNIIVFVS